MAENALNDSRVPICHLCSEPIPIEGAKTDERGRTVHESRYVAKIIEHLRSGSICRLRVIDWISTVPAIGACTACAERFTVPVLFFTSDNCGHGYRQVWSRRQSSAVSSSVVVAATSLNFSPTVTRAGLAT